MKIAIIRSKDDLIITDNSLITESALQNEDIAVYDGIQRVSICLDTDKPIPTSCETCNQKNYQLENTNLVEG